MFKKCGTYGFGYHYGYPANSWVPPGSYLVMLGRPSGTREHKWVTSCLICAITAVLSFDLYLKLFLRNTVQGPGR